MSDADKREVLALLRAQEDSVARGDAAGVVAPLSSNLVTYDLPPPLEYRGAGATYAEGLEQWFATWNGPVTVKLSDPTVIVEGDLAVVFGLSRMSGYKKDSGPFEGWNRRTIVLNRTESTWKIIHEHSSYPLEMDGSGRAATHLQPQHDARGMP